jgi:hypothetical protein
MPETDAEMNARMRQRVTNLEVREKHLSGMVARLQAGERPGGPRWRSALRRVTPPALRPAGRRVLGKLSRNGRPPIPKIEQRQTK